MIPTQNTEEWRLWRRDKLGASDASTVLGLSPWSTPLALWEEKLGIRAEKDLSAAMARGVELEESARLLYEKMCGKMVFPKVVVSDMFDWCIASLDGITPGNDHIVEIKCGGAATHKIALDGRIPEHYYPQLMHQLFVTGLDSVDYFSFDGEQGVIINVKRDNAFIERMIEAELKFMECIKNLTPPEMTDKDFLDMRQDFDFGTFEYQYIQVANQIKDLEVKKEEYKRKLIDLSGGKSAKGDVVRITKKITKGRIDYDCIPEIKDLNLECYRKKPTTSFMITY